MTEARLIVDGTIYGGWQELRVARGLRQVAGRFALTVTERWAGQDNPRPIRPGAACTLQLDGETVISGHVDDVQIDYDAERHTVRVGGRDRTGDLVDSSAIHGGGEIRERTLAQVARDLCRPFGIEVRAEVDVGAPLDLRIEPGDSVFDVLDRLARLRGVLLVSDGDGGLAITRAAESAPVATLTLGETIRAARGVFDHRDRHDRYIIKGQQPGTDWITGEQAARPRGEARDPRVARHRPLILVAEEHADPAALRTRAEWERNVRFGRSREVIYTVQGWRHAGGLWQPNTRVRVRDPFLDIDARLLIAGVDQVLSQDGAQSELRLVPREAFERIPLPEPEPEADPWP